jgi:predicted metalloendopeptidase
MRPVLLLALLALLPGGAIAADALHSGLDLSGFDPSVRPADDLYRFVNGGWQRRTPIPADRSNFGAIAGLSVRAQQDLHRLLEEFVAQPRAPGTRARRLADFYQSFMDETRLAAEGLAPLAGERARIARLRRPRDLAAWLGHAQALGFTTGLDAARVGLDAPLDYRVEADLRDSAHYVGYLGQAGLTLPGRESYLSAAARDRGRRRALQRYAAALLAAAHEPQPQAKAARVLALETALARAQWSAVRARDPLATYHRMTRAELERVAPGLPWARFLDAAGIPADAPLIVEQPDYLRTLARLGRRLPMRDWRAWLSFKLLDGYAAALPAPFADLAFRFHSQTLLGTAEPEPRWQRAVEALDVEMGAELGQEYVARNFSPESRERVRAMVGNLLRAFDAALEDADWMSASTRIEARRKLAQMRVKVGYPDPPREESVEISATDLVANLLRLAAAHQARAVGRLGAGVDRDEWIIHPQTVNAYYYPPANEIVFPAAILQPPFFDPEADDALNYGAIGAAIGHEISHAFDDRGRRYDADGNLRDWWTPEDAAHFEARAAALVAEYSRCTLPGGLRVNGELTLGENLGDLSGLEIAWKAWRAAQGGATSPDLDGFSGEQRFFLGWAQAWRFEIREEALREWLLTNPHSPPEFRVNTAISNLDAFYAAFGVKPGDGMFRPPGDRVKIW